MKQWVQKYIDNKIDQKCESFFKEIKEHYLNFIREEQSRHDDFRLKLVRHNEQIEAGLETLVKLVNYLTKGKNK